MVKSVKAWLIREGSFSRNVRTQLSTRENRQRKIIDVATRQAMTTAFMIKRQGIKPTHFWTNTTKQMTRIVEQELAKALKVDIINSIVE